MFIATSIPLFSLLLVYIGFTISCHLFVGYYVVTIIKNITLRVNTIIVAVGLLLAVRLFAITLYAILPLR